MKETAGERVALIVDDDQIFRNRLSKAFSDRGWDAHAAEDGASALALAGLHEPDLILVDLRLPGMGGLDIVRELRTLDETSCVVMLTGYGSIATAVAATKLGASHYLSKPVDADQIIAAYQSLSGEGGIATETDGDVPSLARVEWEHIQRVLADCDGNVSKAAKLLGLHRRSLQRKLFKYPPRS
jgi:two-component system response regulator RegA